MHQKDLWAFGISGDIPIALVTIDDEREIKLNNSVIKFYYYMKHKGLKLILLYTIMKSFLMMNHSKKAL